MLRKIRRVLALLCFLLVTLLFLDFTGSVAAHVGWLAKIQFLPALLALHAGVLIVWILLTLLFGRIYCSVVCPLGVMQDLSGWLGRRGKKQRNRYTYSPARSGLRYAVLGLCMAAFIAGIGSLVALFAPYSAYGRMVQNLLAPFWAWGNNGLAYLAERADSYAFYETEVWIRSLPTFGIALVMFVGIAVLAWRNGRTWCNTICPVGTLLGFLSRYAWLKPVIDTDQCNRCGLCARRCKAACIDSRSHTIDYSRCVACMDCLDTCHKQAIRYGHPKKRGTTQATQGETPANPARRSFLAGATFLATSATIGAQEKKVDGGLAPLIDKEAPQRKTPIVPPGALGLRHMANHCTGCQLCVAACPNGVLRPSTALRTLMQPESSYERGYCRPECTRCSEVCPAGAIQPISVAEKSAIQVGHAVWIRTNCVPLTDGVACGNCARHCPAGAILMVPSDPERPDSLKIPAVNVERCTGCGACENLCPARPFSAIYVEGYELHREL